MPTALLKKDLDRSVEFYEIIHSHISIAHMRKIDFELGELLDTVQASSNYFGKKQKTTQEYLFTNNYCLLEHGKRHLSTPYCITMCSEC